MGREVRRVPPDWEHPKDWRGNYQPMYDRSYGEAAERWLRDCMAWEAGMHPDLVAGRTTKAETPYFWEWDGLPPQRDWYRPEWPDDARTAYQVYENVTEGTPVSPVFANEAALRVWLLREGHAAESVDAFLRLGWAPSGIAGPGIGFVSGIDAMGVIARGAGEGADGR